MKIQQNYWQLFFKTGTKLFFPIIIICGTARVLAAQEDSDISFYLTSTNDHLSSRDAYLRVTLMAGSPTPLYQAILINGANKDDAVWTKYISSNINFTLPDAGNGEYMVRVGLSSGRDSVPFWNLYNFYVDTDTPQIFITSPTERVLSQSLIQLTGYGSEEMEHYSYDLSNSMTVVTDQFVPIVKNFFDKDVWKTTTNYFQIHDLQLAKGANNITLYATTRAGKTGHTNITLVLDYSNRTKPPVIQEDWPKNGDYLSGNSFLVNGTLDDPSTKIVASIVNSSGDTKNVNGLVGRDGKYYVHNVPLADGTNYLTLTATDVMGKTATTNLMVIKSPVAIHVDKDVFQSAEGATVTGTINTNNYTVLVNGVRATMNGTNWSALITQYDRHGGTVDVQAVPNSK